ncbi:hypothetical protein [Nocardia sp. NPDC003345]
MRLLARRQGHTLIYIVRIDPDSIPDPIGHVLDIIRATNTATLIVPDLSHLENHPGRVCDSCDLMTVCPGQLWMKAGSGARSTSQAPHWLPEIWHGEPCTRLRISDAHSTMQAHRTCNPLDCPRKAAAFARLVEAGKVIPATRSPRERAAARGIAFPPAERGKSGTMPSLAILERLLTGLSQVR